jgi:hypothetical protein
MDETTPFSIVTQEHRNGCEIPTFALLSPHWSAEIPLYRPIRIFPSDFFGCCLFISLKMAVRSCESSGYFKQTAWRCIPECFRLQRNDCLQGKTISAAKAILRFPSSFSQMVIFEVLTATSVKTVACDVAACSLTDNDRRFRGAYCLHNQVNGSWLARWLVCL